MILACKACLIAITAALLAPSASANAMVHVGGWALTANGQLAKGFEYTGACPAQLKFDFGLMANAPTEIKYTFTRNDGGRSSTNAARIVQANQNHPTTDEWRLGANDASFKNYHGWLALELEAPNKLTHRIAFTLHCK